MDHRAEILSYGRLKDRRRARQPLPLVLTRGGWIYLAACAFICLAAINSQVNLLYFVFGLSVGLAFLSLGLGSLSLRGLEIERDFAESIMAGEPAEVEYRLRNTKRYWPCMALRLAEVHPELIEAPRAFVLYLPAAGKGGAEWTRLRTRLAARRRGAVQLADIEVSTTFPFGFLRRTRRLRFPQEMVVYPRIGMLNRHLALQYRESIEIGAMTSNRRGGNDEFYGVREYRPGDNIRAIHWRSSARTGQLMIREMASNAPPQLIIVLNLRAWRDGAGGSADAAGPGENVEWAIELAAALVCYGHYENFAVALVVAGLTGGPPPVPETGREARGRHLRELAMIDPRRLTEGHSTFPTRLAGRAEWVVVTLHSADRTDDLLPVGASSMVTPVGGSVGGAGAARRTILPLDDPDAGQWIHFLAAQDALRLLRERSG